MSREVPSPSFDDCLRALEDERRRTVISALRDAETLAVATLADGERSECALIHCHLPLLEERGYVDWDRGTGDVRRGPRFDEVATLFDLLRSHEHDLPWTIT